MNVLDGIARVVRAYPALPALVTGGRTLDFKQLWQRCGALAWQLQQRGVATGDGVALSGLTTQNHFLAVLALARIGAVSTSIMPGVPAQAKQAIARRHAVRHWFRGESDTWKGTDGLNMIPESIAGEVLATGTRLPPLVRGLDDKPWRITLSSGTTGASKSIPWTHGQRLASQENALESYNGGPGERLFIAASLGIGFTVGQALTHLASGGTVILLDTPTPQAALDTVLAQHPTRMLTTTAMASTFADHVAQSGREGPLPGLISLMVAGSAVPPALMASLEKHVCANVVVNYGSTELGSTARSDPASRAAAPASAGRLCPWIEGGAVNDKGEPLPPGEQGLLRFRARRDAMASAYIGEPAAAAQAFRDGWFYPGDRGAVDAQRNLFLQGRTDDIVNLGGVKVDAARIEKMAQAYPGVKEAAAVPIELAGGRQVLAVAVVTQPGADVPALRQRLRADGGVMSMLVGVKDLPKNAGGKVMRKELGARLAKAVNSRMKKPAAE